MTPEEAATILGVTPKRVRKLQASGHMPNPIPDDYLDAVVNFRLKLEMAHQRRLLIRDTDVAPS